MKAAIYIRVSSQEQTMPGHYSLSAQEELCREYAKEHQMQVYKVYADEGISASKSLLKRKALLEMLEDAEKGKFQCILFKDITRWSRNASNYYKVQDRLDKCKVGWISVQQPYLETMTPTGRFQVSVMLGTSQLEAEQTGERIKFVQDAQLREGYYPFPDKCVPLGYKNVRTADGHMKLTVDPEKSEVVKELFRVFLMTGNRQRCIEKAAEMGVRVTKDMMTNMVRNRTYLGEVRGMKGFVEPLISEEDWNTIQQILSHRNYTRRTDTYIFSSLCRCGVCGGSMYGTTNTSSLSIWYRCDRCKHNMISQKKLEPKVLDEVDEYVHDLEIHAQSRKAVKQTDVKKLRGKLDRLNELYIEGNISKSEYERRRTALEAQISTLTAVKGNMPKVFNGTWKEAYKRLDEVKKNVLWKSVVDCIIVNADKTISIKFAP